MAAVMPDGLPEDEDEDEDDALPLPRRRDPLPRRFALALFDVGPVPTTAAVFLAASATILLRPSGELGGVGSARSASSWSEAMATKERSRRASGGSDKIPSA